MNCTARRERNPCDECDQLECKHAAAAEGESSDDDASIYDRRLGDADNGGEARADRERSSDGQDGRPGTEDGGGRRDQQSGEVSKAGAPGPVKHTSALVARQAA